MQRERCPLPHTAILEEVWGLRDDTDTRAIDDFIARRRRAPPSLHLSLALQAGVF